MSMLLMPDKFCNAIQNYSATAPDMAHEGMNGYMEVEASFYIKDLRAFTDLWYDAYKFPSDRASWYHDLKNAALCK